MYGNTGLFTVLNLEEALNLSGPNLHKFPEIW
jgi:hypothetical protein